MTKRIATDAGLGLRRLVYGLTVACTLASCATPTQQHAVIGRHIAPEEACTAQVYGHPPPDFDVADHMLITTPLGGYERATEADFAPTFEAQFTRMMLAHARYRSTHPDRPDRFLLFINGGLTGLDFNISRAREQMPCMIRDGYFPVFLVSQTAGFDAYWDQVSRVRTGRQYDSPRWDTPFYFLADLGAGITRAPETWLSQFRRFAGAEITYMKSSFTNTPVVQSDVLNLQYEGPEDTPANLLSGGLKYGVTSPFKIIAIPITVSFGQTAWENMERRAHATIHQSTEFNPSTRDSALTSRYPKGTGLFSRFMAELEHCASRDESCLGSDRGASFDRVELTVISHSLGSQIAEDLVSLYDDLPYRNIVHLGSGSSIRHFTETLQPVLRKRPEIRFYNVSIHPSADAREVTVYGFAPSGSMLEWIDDMIGSPITPLDRTMGKWLNDAAAEYVFDPNLRDRIIFRVFGFRPPDPATGDPGDPVMHSEMLETRMEYWRPDFWSLPTPLSEKPDFSRLSSLLPAREAKYQP